VQGDRLHVTGVTFPSVPLFPIGHNERIAWGATNVEPDVQDLYVERINPANPNQVEVNGAWVDMTITEEIIHVDGQDEPLRWAARATRHGPLISDVQGTDQPVALRWTALDPDDTTVDAFMGVNYAQNWEDFRAAMADYVAPSQNFVYADVDGNIGYFMSGRIPIRAQGEGMLPVPGWNDDYAWEGFIPLDELPQAFNPEQGYVATANNRVVDDRYPYMISNDFAEPYRAERIVELIEQYSSNGETISLQEMAAIQADQASAQARAMLPFVRSLTPADDRQRQALALLAAWDGTVAGDSAAAAIYKVWSMEFDRLLIEDDLSNDLWDELSTFAHPVFVQNILADEALQQVWCDDVTTPGPETCEAIGVQALEGALDALAARLGANMERWTWQAVHHTQYPHRPFSDVGYLRPFFHRSIPNGGDGFTVNVAPASRDQPYDQFHGPSYRQLVDLADWQAGRFIITTGQSGNVLSPHYADFIERHRNVEYLPMTFGSDAARGDLLTLQP
jgi:penicillin amidase